MKENKNSTMKTINELKASPVLYLSGGSKELFHSNFLYWLGLNYRDAFQELMTKMCGINGSSHSVRRILPPSIC